jgi:hypothetical protein
MKVDTFVVPAFALFDGRVTQIDWWRGEYECRKLYTEGSSDSSKFQHFEFFFRPSPVILPGSAGTQQYPCVGSRLFSFVDGNGTQ